MGAAPPAALSQSLDRLAGQQPWKLMQDTAGTWLMTALTTSPLLIALMQTAASLPVLFLGLPAGATADMFDRRRLLIFGAWMLARWRS